MKSDSWEHRGGYHEWRSPSKSGGCDSTDLVESISVPAECVSSRLMGPKRLAGRCLGDGEVGTKLESDKVR